MTLTATQPPRVAPTQVNWKGWRILVYEQGPSFVAEHVDPAGNRRPMGLICPNREKLVKHVKDKIDRAIAKERP